MRNYVYAAAVAGLAVLASRPAAAQMEKYTEAGMSFSAGGGVIDNTDDDTRDFTDTGGTWEARVAAGTQRMLTLEAAYIGSAQGLDAVGLDGDAILLGSTLEAAARFNLVAEGLFQPYGLVGAAWKHYDITNDDFNTSAVNDDDDMLEVPIGVGVAFRPLPVVIDARLVYRPALGDETLPGDAEMDTWGATVRAGFEF